MTATALRPGRTSQLPAFEPLRASQRPEPTVSPAYADADVVARKIAALVSELRERDADPAYASAPVLDPYGRISANEDGVEEKTDRQLLDILSAMRHEFCRLGVLLVDNGKSAWKRNRNRPGWNRLIERIEKRVSNGAFVWHVDRLMRQPKDLETLVDFAWDGAVTVGSCYGSRDLRDDNQLFYLRMEVAAACKASADTSRRIRRKKQAERDAGRMDRADVFGHPSVGVSVEQVEREADAIRWAIQSVVDGASWRTVANEWIRRGIVSRNGYPMHPLKVRNILLLPRHAGLLTYDEDVPGRKTKARKVVGVLRDVEPIVPMALWEEFQAVLKVRERGRPRNAANHLLTGMIRCGECGTMMAASTTKIREVVYRQYRCPVSGCGEVRITAEVAEAWAYEHALAILSDPKHARQVARRSKELATVLAKIDAKVTLRKQISEFLSSDKLSIDEANKALTTVRDAIAELEAQRQALEAAGASDVKADPKTRAELIAEWEGDDSDSQELRRAMLANAMPLGIRVGRSVKRERRQTLDNSRYRLARNEAKPAGA